MQDLSTTDGLKRSGCISVNSVTSANAKRNLCNICSYIIKLQGSYGNGVKKTTLRQSSKLGSLTKQRKATKYGP